MTEHGDGVPGLFPVPGDGVLARHGNLILLCSLEVSQTADDLLDLLEQTAAVHGDGRQFVDAIADALDSDEGAPSVRPVPAWPSPSAAARGPTSQPAKEPSASRPAIRACCCAARCARQPAVSGAA